MKPQKNQRGNIFLATEFTEKNTEKYIINSVNSVFSVANFSIQYIKIKSSKFFFVLFIFSVLSVVSLLPSPLHADYLWPLKEKTYLTGTFGEFRKTHIHAGVDISTKKQIGLPVHAGESGILYRVKTQYKGFGKTVYLKLPNGNFLVYAHLDKFSPKIENIIKIAQLKQDRYAIDIYPKSKININKGELTGYSGDTGGVMPHLHMELRDPEERPINILKDGLDVSDNRSPIISGLAVCDPETSFLINYYPAGNIPTIPVSGKAGLAVSVYEESHGNKLGVYRIDLFIDKELFFRVKMDSFSYDEFRDNFFVYNKDLFINHNKIYYNLFRTFGNTLPFYPLDTNGILDLAPGKHSITIKTIDFKGNSSILNATIIAKAQKESPKTKFKKSPWYSEDGKLCLKIKDLYSPVDIEIKNLSIKPTNQELAPVSKAYDIGPEAAVFKEAIISIAPPLNPEKVNLYRLENGRWKYIENNECRSLGKFCLFKDSIPPKIKVISPFRAEIEDNGSGLDYPKLALYLDGEKLIAEYSINKEELFYNAKLHPGNNKVTWIAADRAGNQAKVDKLYNE